MPSGRRRGWRRIAGLALGLVALGAWGANCPQPRFTGKAPDEYYTRPNPLQADGSTLSTGQALFLRSGGGKIACAACHGKKGDGKGPLASQFDPPPRNFTCAQTIKDVPDGQLFWIIRFGSPGTSMPPHKGFSDNQIWTIVLYLRELAR